VDKTKDSRQVSAVSLVVLRASTSLPRSDFLVRRNVSTARFVANSPIGDVSGLRDCVVVCVFVKDMLGPALGSGLALAGAWLGLGVPRYSVPPGSAYHVVTALQLGKVERLAQSSRRGQGISSY